MDQGGCIETIRPTSHTSPTYELHGVIHYGVPNMPGAVPRTSTFALTNTTLHHVEQIAALGPAEAVRRDPSAAPRRERLARRAGVRGRGRVARPALEADREGARARRRSDAAAYTIRMRGLRARASSASRSLPSAGWTA